MESQIMRTITLTQTEYKFLNPIILNIQLRLQAALVNLFRAFSSTPHQL